MVPLNIYLIRLDVLGLRLAIDQIRDYLYGYVCKKSVK